MGTPTGAIVVHDDGREERLEVAAALALDADDRRVELLYDYRPELVPGGPFPGDGLWRYRDLLPLGNGPIRYPLPVGGTPLIAPTALRERLGIAGLWLKDETRSPSCSNKDRATALVLEAALAAGARRVTAASTGNVAVSLSIGAAAAGLEAIVFVGSEVAESKLALMLAAGATVVKVRGGYEAAFRLSREAARAFGWFDRNTGVNPATTEAKKTVAFEIWEQLGREVPDVVAVPVGDGPTLNGIAKGFRELVACGVADRVPRLIGVQAAGCQPIKHAWEAGGLVAPVTPDTIADGIAVAVPVTGTMAVRDVARSGGAYVAVEDEEMLQAIRFLAAGAGVLAEPAAAASLAGVRAAIRADLVDPGERIVALVTGSLLKTPRYLSAVGRVAEVDPSLGALEAALGG